MSIDVSPVKYSDSDKSYFSFLLLLQHFLHSTGDNPQSLGHTSTPAKAKEETTDTQRITATEEPPRNDLTVEKL